MMLFELLPFFKFCTLQFCKCDISESNIGTGPKLLSALKSTMRRLSSEDLKQIIFFFLVIAV